MQNDTAILILCILVGVLSIFFNVAISIDDSCDESQASFNKRCQVAIVNARWKYE